MLPAMLNGGAELNRKLKERLRLNPEAFESRWEAD